MRIFKAIAVVFCLMFTALASAADLSVTRITPAGEDVAHVDQIVIEFNRDVVPLGNMDRKSEKIPVLITPAVNCHWRWLTRNTLACQLDVKNKLKQATRYTVTVNRGIKAEDGAIASPFTHQFITQRPDINNVWIETWLTPKKPVIHATFTQLVAEESLNDHLYFLDKSSNKRISVKIEKEKIQRNKFVEQSDVDSQAEILQGWFITPSKDLPSNAEVILMMEPGVKAVAGTEPSALTKELMKFYTFAEFKYLGMTCRNSNGDMVEITPEKPQSDNESSLCDPLAVINLNFTTPVAQQELKHHVKLSPSIKVGGDDEEGGQFVDQLFRNLAPGENYTFSLHLSSSVPLKSTQHYTISLLPESTHGLWNKIGNLFGIRPKGELVDAFGRHLENPITINFKTSHRKPHHVLAYNTAILEKNTDSDVPLYVTNLQKINIGYTKLTQQGLQNNLQVSQALPEVHDLQYAVPLEIRKMLNGQSGVVDLSITTEPQVNEEPTHLIAQVTPYQVEVKIGHFNSLIWVTDFATGLPMQNAKVMLYWLPDELLNEPANVFATAKTDAYGLAVLPGTADFNVEKPAAISVSTPSKRNVVRGVTGAVGLSADTNVANLNTEIKKHWMVRIDTANDMAWMPLDYDFRISSYHAGDVYSRTREKYGHITTWGTTAQGIYRPGETIQYKIYVRDQNVRTLAIPPEGNYQVDIKDPTGKVVQTVKNIKLDNFGTLQGEYTVSREAVAGYYSFSLSSTFSKDSWEPLQVLVTDFVPASFKVSNQLNGDAFTTDQMVEVTTNAKLHAGGPYGNASLRVTAAIQPKTFATQNPSLKDFDFYQSDVEQQNAVEIFQKIVTLDKNGESQLQFKLEPQKTTFGTLSVESAVQDERGKYVVSHTRANYFGVDRFLGWHPKQWLFTTGKPAQIDYVVVDTKGNPAANTKVNIVIEHEVNKAARVKTAGNVYGAEYQQSWEKVAECQNTSQTQPLTCEFTPSKAGNYRLTATLNDTKNNTYTAHTAVWAAGRDYVVWGQEDDVALPIVPEKSSFQVGENARFLIKNPYPGALALITIERYGVIDHWVQKLDGSTPVITVPIKPDYLPGFYLSVSIFTPRANNNPLKVGEIDLAKPATRFGYQRVVVDDPYKQLLITATTDHATYKPGEQVNVQMHVKPRQGQTQPVELAVAVVDEAVLDLLHDAHKHYDLYHGMYQLDSLDLETYSLINGLVGRQKFEKKGANPGGDGGAGSSMRSLFKYVSYWNPSVVVDKTDQANVSFTVPDNLTRWRVVMLGITHTDQMGTGSTSFNVMRPTEVRPVMPNHVLAGDHFMAGFSVMNRLNKTREIRVDIKASGAINSKQSTTHYQTTLTLQPFERKIVTMPIVVGAYDYNTTPVITFTAKAGDAIDTDGLSQKIEVDPLVSLETFATYGSSDQNHVEESVLVPNKIQSNAGQISLALTPTVIGNIEGVFRYAREYPYACWEQKLTKAVLATQYKVLRNYLATSLQWPNSEAVVNETLKDAANYQASNGGMAFFVASDQYADPYLSAYTASMFNWLKQQGYVVPEVVMNNLVDYLQKFLRQDASRDFYTQSMTATVRAVALSAIAEKSKIDAADLDRLRDYLPNMSLFGLANYLQAALHVENSDALQHMIISKIMSHAQQDPDKIVFTEKLDDGYQRILSSPVRDNCAVLTAMLDYQKLHPTDNNQAYFFKVVRGITQARGSRDHWKNTQENLFCMNALALYSQIYEKENPNMQFAATINNGKLGEGHLMGMQAMPLIFLRPLQKQDVGQKFTIGINRNGLGRFYYNTRLQYAPLDLLSQDENHGIEVHREYSVQREGKWILLNTIGNTIKPGEIVRVDLYLNLTSPHNFVVVDDPVAGGLEPVNTQLATSSAVDAMKANYVAASGSMWLKFNDWREYNMSFWSFYHQEMRNNAVRFYADHLDPGHYHLSYVAQTISSGEFTLLPTTALEMYTPEVNGKTKAQKLVIGK